MDFKSLKGLCSLCARGGSKGVKNKNLIHIKGIPLIAHSIIQARESNLFQEIAVSSDSDEILKAAEKYGATILIDRPQDMAQDSSPKLPVIKHCASEAEKRSNTQFDYFIDLDATSPLRSVADIIEVSKLLFSSDAISNVITGTPSRRSPYFNMVEVVDGKVSIVKALDKNVTRRQDSPKTYDMNASIYAWKRNFLFQENSIFQSQTSLYVMPEERSLDIDSPLDLEIVNYLMTRQ